MDARFSLSLQNTMNEMAADGWEFQRAETLPCDERSGLTSTTTTFRNVLVFRRPMDQAASFVRPPREEPEPAPQPTKAEEKAETVNQVPSEETISSDIPEPQAKEAESQA